MNIAILGQGYVGLALAKAALVAGHNVTGFDTNVKVIEAIKEQITEDKIIFNENYLYYCCSYPT